MPMGRRASNPSGADFLTDLGGNFIFETNLLHFNRHMSGPDSPRGLDRNGSADGPERVADGGPTYDPTTDTYVARFEMDSPSLAVMEALAAIRHCEPTELEPLYRAIDPDALDRLVASGTDQLRIGLTVDGFDVVVTGDRRLEITPPS